jgi:MFS family permease
LPIFAKDILGGGPVTLGLLTSFASLGALFASIYIASKKEILGADKRLFVFGLLFAVSLVLFSFSTMLAFSLALISLVGAGMMGHNVSANSLIQNLTSEEKRGRVMSFYAFSHQGMMPFGELLLGILAGIWGGSTALIFSGLFTAIALIIFAPGIMRSINIKS